MKRFKKGFTLAEVLITLAIIGVVAGISIPSVISNSQQQEFKTGLRKAVSVLNSAITMNMAIDGETPYDNANLPQYLMRHMNIIKSSTSVPYYTQTNSAGGTFWGESNGVFYTVDGMRFEFNHAENLNEGRNKLHESDVMACTSTNSILRPNYGCMGCGSYGLKHNPNNTTKPPCLVMVDVNGDRKPNPSNVNCQSEACGNENTYKYSDAIGKKLTDVFSIIITDKKAIPYGVAAQKAMYQAQK